MAAHRPRIALSRTQLGENPHLLERQGHMPCPTGADIKVEDGPSVSSIEAGPPAQNGLLLWEHPRVTPPGSPIRAFVVSK
jgi:hypothetical protein